MKGWRNCLLTVICVLFLSSCAGTWGRIPAGFEHDGKYDYSTVHLSVDLEKYSNSFPVIEASGIPFYIKEDGEKNLLDKKETAGHAVIIPPYVLTMAHIVDLRRVSVAGFTPYGPTEIQAYAEGVQDEVYFLKNSGSSEKIPLEKIRIYPEGDWALFKMPEGSVFDYPALPLGRSGELKPGHAVYVFGTPRMVAPALRSGIVSSTAIVIPEKVKKDTVELYGHLYGADLSFLISTALIGGDSGSRVIALRDGQPEIVGLVHASYLGVMGMVSRIDKVLSQILEETGIDLRKQNEENMKKHR